MKSDSNKLLEVTKLEVVYNHVSTAIQGVSFNICEGQIFAIIGGNGAGKTTTLRAISGFLNSDNAVITDGEIKIRDRSINMLKPQDITRQTGIVLVPERNKVFETLTVQENLAVPTSIGKRAKETIQNIYTYFPSLYERRKSLAGLLSGGERQMLAIGQAMLCSPELLLIDELSLGLSPVMVEALFEILLKIKADFGLSILLVEQNAMEALSIAEYAAVMENGMIVLAGTPEKLMAHEDVKEFYLGIRGKEKKRYKDVKQYSRTRRWWG
ncbi:leucine/isoleucine/valine transporter subunit; ATP-binding component of ABC superfamily [uncultured Desulfobacterium sp.]|uniref:Leucine/isoleucine/valine transporter subunit ATP-binding component of ABC superfamily n=1 Tax=uncultured Desulfobacterium sp. TaxID=201089 RepID=A0A445MSR6_9BACT|nr:leucine/isoleucine/valine transporter subunit; ATP-binding component of ABC superfamily [uncultured Desulfobacterium sp.]